MNAVKLVGLQELFSHARRVSKRVWLIVAGVTVCLVALLAWAGIALVGAAWSQLPQVAESGKRVLEAATQRMEHVAPNLKQGVAEVLSGVGERASGIPPASDVSGTDIGPVARYPGLIRAEFSQDATNASVRFVGRAPLPTVLAHYVGGFTSAGYVHDVLSATSGRELHRFSTDNGSAAYELSLEHLDRELLAVTLIQIPT